MELEVVQERIKAISYLLENDMIHNDAIQEAEEELYELTQSLSSIKQEDNNVNEKDPVEPSHYSGIEFYKKCAKNTDAFEGFLHLNALKYMERLHFKDGALQDAKKSRWYINELVKELTSRQ